MHKIIFQLLPFLCYTSTMQEINLRNYAYIGDAVWELKIRSKTITLTNNAKTLHKITTEKVKAEFQAECLHLIEPILSESELELAKRGRNLPIPVGRKQMQVTYRQSTAFETLIGWWHLNSPERLEEIYQFLADKL